MNNQSEMLLKILNLSEPNNLDLMVENLNKFKVKNQEQKLTNQNLLDIINRFEKGKISDKIISKWAKIIEIDLDDFIVYTNEVGTVLNWLASPEINGKIDKQMVSEIKELLQD